MKFNEINIPQIITGEKGIIEIKIKRLSSVVAFVGRNGSGKSRILDLIEGNCFNNIPIQRILDNTFSHLPESLQEIRRNLLPFSKYFLLSERLQQIQAIKKKDNSNKEIIKEFNIVQKELSLNGIPSNSQDIVNSQYKSYTVISPTLKQHYFRRIKGNDIKQLKQAIDSPGKNIPLTFEELLGNIKTNIDYNELDSLSYGGLSFLAKLPHQLTLDKVECLIKDLNFEEKLSFKRFISLKKFIQDFLGKDLTWEQKAIDSNMSTQGVNVNYIGIWKLNKRVFNYNEFSDGEKFLFAYALLFFLLDENPKLNIKESILLIDEPELHLHPESEVALLEGIRNVIGKEGQVIIATHSISILSHLNYDEIFMVKDNKVRHPSHSTPGDTLIELMGLDIRVNKLANFISSISTWTYVNFMAECFSNPDVIESAQENDPQVKALKLAIKEISLKSNNLLLDFGAGKGRVIQQLKEDYTFLNSIAYSAVEPEVEFHTKLLESGVETIYKTHNEIPNGKFDFVVICNVLHEIKLDEWELTLNNIIKSLAENGFLIIIEAKNLTKGEKIGTTGFLLLDIEELRELFQLSHDPSSISIGESKNSITCCILTKAILKPVTRESIIKCLIELKNNSLTKIELLRNSVTPLSPLHFGRQSAFLSQLNINAQLALKYLQGK